MMNTLVLSRFRPGRPDGGAALRNLQNIHGLAQLGRVSVLSLHEDEEKLETFENVHSWKHCRITPAPKRSIVQRACTLLGLLSGCASHYALSRYFTADGCREIQAMIEKDQCEVVVIEELSLAHYAPFVKNLGCRVIFDAHNVEGILRDEMENHQGSRFSNWRSRRYGKILYREERKVITMSDAVWACSQVDIDLLKKLYQKEVDLVPNGLRIQDYHYNHSNSRYAENWKETPLRLLYLGSYSYYPNEDAALNLMRNILPELKARGRDVELVILGRGPTEEMQSVAANLPEVTITGGVETVHPYLEEKCIACLPIRLGSGTRLKILEAFAAMRPVVSTSKGAEGILADSGKHLFIAEEAPAFADAVTQIWDNQELRTEMCRRAFELVKINYSWESAGVKIKDSLIRFRSNLH